MFRTKKDVDRHVQDLFRKLKGEKERKCKYFNISRLYFQVGDYESARKYVASFLSIREDSSSAHKLLGQCLEALGQKESALAEYKCSLMLESNQSDLVLKVCELMADPDLKVDKDSAKYWSERAEQLFPHNPTVFKLKEKMVTSDEENCAAELEKLIMSELSARPKDVSLHIRLLQLYLEAGRIKEAYSTGMESEIRSAFREDLKWYECLIEVCKAYAEISKPCGWEFFFHYTSILERSACLNLQEQYGSPRRTWAQAVHALFTFDQVLEVASCQTPPSSEVTMYQEFLRHQRGQLCLHFATALFKKAKREPSTWADISRAVAPLLLHALVTPVDIDAGWVNQIAKSRRKCVEWWAKEGAYRNSQAGHLIQSLVTERRSHFLERVMQFCTGNWRERLFQKIFNTRDHHQAIGTSHLVNHSIFATTPLHIPSSGELRPHDEMSQHLYPNSLHHMIWLGLRELAGCSRRGGSARLGADFRCLVFENLQFSCCNPSLSGSETLCQLDIDAFLYASILCAKATQDEEQAAGFRSNDRPQTLPANITDYLCTISQAKWWNAAFRVNTNQARGDLGEIRQILQRGVEVVRVLGNHGLDVRLIVQLARIFSERASVMAARALAPMEMAEVEARAAMYWTSALPLLDKLQRNQTVRAPHTRLFEYQGKDLSMAEINTLLEEGRYFLACQMMKEEKHEKAIEAFQQLKSPYASFHQAMIYKKLAALELEEQQGELITSEMRSRHIILLTKVRECLYLTLDRLRSPGVDRKHPLNAELSAYIEEIESQLARIDPDVWRSDVNRNDLDGISDGSVSSGPSVGENGNYGLMSALSPRHLSTSRFHSTPYRNNHSHRVDSDTLAHDHSRRTEARPSPERLEAQIRHLMHGRDAQMQQVMQQNKSLLESHRTVAENLNKVALSLEELKNLIQELIKKDTHKRSESRMNSDLPQVGDTDDDLYVFDEDYSEDVNIAASHLGQFQAFPQYSNYPGASYRQLPGMMGSNTVTYGPPTAGAENTNAVPPAQLLPPAAGMGNFFRNVDPSLIYPQTLSYFSQGALPFSEGQQLPDFRSAPPGAPPGSVFSRLGPAPGASAVPGTDSQGLHATPKLNAPPSQPAPVNVVITSSDTLPTTVPQTQPTLSVTIPPQHRLGTPLVHPTVPPPVVGALTQPPPGIPPVIPAGVPPAVVPPIVAPVVAPGVPPGVPSGIPSGAIAFSGVPGGALPPALPGQLPLNAGLSVTPVVTSATGTVPHAFQISMPPQAQVPVASRLEKGAAALSPVLPISTQTLLSSVPSPVYSAIGFEKTTKESGSPVTTTTATTSPTTPVGSKVQTIPPKPNKGQRVSTGSVAESEDGTEEVEHDPCPDFQPVIPLPAEVEVTTGEEQEVVLYECRCKLFRFVDKEWKERGIGILKMLHNQETGKVRLLMRREQVLKVCANHFLTPDMSLTRMKDKAWMWVANDFADEQMRLEKLCVRFKTPDDAVAFADAFNNACELARNAKPTPTKGSSKHIETRMSDVTTSATNSLNNSTPASSPAEKIVVGGFTFISPPKFTTTSSSKIQAEKEIAKEKEKSAAAVKPSPFAQFSFSAPSNKPSLEQSSVNALVGSPLIKLSSSGAAISSSLVVSSPVKLPTSGTVTTSAPSISVTTQSTSEREQLPPLRRPHLSSLVTSSSPALEVIQKEKPKEKDSAGGGDPLMFKAANLPTFSSLASLSSDKQAFQASNSFKGFDGAGTPLFSKAPAGDTKKDKKVGSSPSAGGVGGDEGDEEFVPTQEFTPVIAMPELIEVKTGEEGQEVVFQERSKLLRFDSETKQWKERGTGTMKVLKDPQTGRVRLLMRREQVLKVCCNHMLTSSISFTILQTCDRAWTWYAQDYSEGEVKPELFALRFKTVEQTQAFGSKIRELQAQMVDDEVPVNVGSICASNSSATISSSTPLVPDKPTTLASVIWKCSKCSFSNANDSLICRSCSTSQTRDLNTPPPQKVEKLKLSEMFKPPAGSWECTDCYTRNNANSEQCVCCSKTRAIRSPPKSLSEPFKPKQGSWECKNCFSRNEESDRRCSSCGSDKPSATPTKQNGPTVSKPLSELFKPKPDTWECKVCMIRNESSAIQCAACSVPKPGCEQEVKEKNKTEQSGFGSFVFSSTGQSTGFTFGIPKQNDDNGEKEKTEKSSHTAGFSFGVNNSQTVFGGTTFQGNSPQHSESETQSQGTSQPVIGSPASPHIFGLWSSGCGFTSSIGGGSSNILTTAATTSLTFGIPTTSSTNAKTQSTVVTFSSGTKQESDKPFSFEAKPVAFQFGTSSNASKTFNFGTKETSEKKASPAETGPRNFVFGSPQSFEFNFSGVRPKSPVKSPKSPGVIGVSGEDDESSSEPEEDEGEHIYFQPVIPLPDKVPTHTGEEEEDVLYSHRAKLFRFVDGSWKERGVGDIKILKHQKTHKVRLVMRRDAILKLCLNHFLTPGMVFSEKDEKSWFWFAADFSEGEITQEKLAIRFQNKDVAIAFKEAIDKAQANLAFPEKTDDDRLGKATDTKESVSGNESGKDGGSITGLPKMKFAGHNTTSSLSSDSKGVIRSLFGGNSPLSRSPAALDLTTNDEDLQVVYELTVTPEEMEAAEKLRLPPNFYSYKRQPGCPGCCGCEPDSDQEDIDAGKRAELSSEVHENEKALQSSLFSTSDKVPFSSSSYILPPTTQPSSFVFNMPSTNTTGVSVFGSSTPGSLLSSVSSSAGSVFGTPSISASTNALTSFSFSPNENKDIKPVLGQSPQIGFGQKSDSVSIFGKASSNAVTVQDAASASSVFGPGSHGTSFSSDAQDTLSVFGPPPSQKSFGQSSDKPLFAANPTQFSFFGGSSVSGTVDGIGSPSATPVFGLGIQAPSSTTNTDVTIASQFSAKTSSEQGKPFVFKIPSIPTERKDETQEEIPDKPLFFNATSTSTSDKSGKSEEMPKVKEQVEEGVPFLPTDSSLTFTSLASQEKAAFFKTSDSNIPFSWAGAGTQVFGASQSKTSVSKTKESTPKESGDADGSSGEEDVSTNAEDNHDPHFEPIIALPDAIEVRTGEEEEERVFCERAKLYRYETDVKQWKERGVGEMKILKHPVQGTFRLLLRREQVHKVVLNQLMTSDLELSYLADNETAWCWYGVNFAEDETSGELRTDPKLEKLGVRFKNVDLAKQFFARVSECVAELKARPRPAVIQEIVENTENPIVTLHSAEEEEEEEETDKEKEKIDSDDEDENDDEEEEDEEDEDENDHNLRFEKRATLEAQEPENESWKRLGMGALQILYDHDNCAARIYMEADNSRDELCNVLISTNIDLQVVRKDCIWTAENHSFEPPVTRTYRARFSSEKAAQEFRSVFEGGKELAQQDEDDDDDDEDDDDDDDDEEEEEGEEHN